MATSKKQIVEWFEERGRDTKDYDDKRKLLDFLLKNGTSMLDVEDDYLNHRILIYNKRWKDKIIIKFSGREAYQIKY